MRLFNSVLIALCLFSADSFAWGQSGHRVVGKIAERHLEPGVLQAIQPLLGGDRLAEVTTWADEMRADPSDFWQKTTPRWHYISIDSWSDFKAHNHQHDYNGDVTDVYTGILKSISVLKDLNADLKTQQLYFRFLTHLVGDIHQPLHVGRKADRGGNDIKVTFFNQDTNLHSLWDTKLIDSQQLSFSEYANFIDTQDNVLISEYQSASVEDWVKESFEERKAIYAVGKGDFKYRYKYQHMPTVEKRLLQAGIRLAGLLNNIYGKNKEQGSK